MDYLSESDFNSEAPHKMFLDINSCFATIEQQANPLLRGKEVAVAAYKCDHSCILAASKEAKNLGIKTGWKVAEAKKICSNIIVITPDPPKYRFVHKEIRKILENFSPRVNPRSIDEFAINFNGIDGDLWKKAKDIKAEIKNKVGEWITVSIGIAPNFFLAKLASNLIKPDGLVKIDKNNFEEIYQKLELESLPGIAFKSKCKLEVNNILKVNDFYNCGRQELRSIFHSIWADYWYWRLRGFEIDEEKKEKKKSFSSIVTLKIPAKNRDELAAIFYQLCLKVGRRAKRQKQGTKRVVWWAGGDDIQIEGRLKSEEVMTNGWEIFESFYTRIGEFRGEIKKVVVVIDHLCPRYWQEDIFGIREKLWEKSEIAQKINDKFGENSVFPGNLLNIQRVADSIGFGNFTE